MIIGTFGGWNVIDFPTQVPASIILNMNDKVAATPGEFSTATQVLDWQLDAWDGELSWPQMKREDAQRVTAFLAEARGASCVFSLGNPLNVSPVGAGTGNPHVLGTNPTRSTSLGTKGWKPFTFRLMKAGEHFQIGQRLHMALNDVNSDGGGNAIFTIWPRIREAPADGDPLILRSPKGLFRLASNKRTFEVSNDKVYAMGIKFTEAL
jgi:hypothetical protein